MRSVGSTDDAAERGPCCQGAIAAMLTLARATAATTRYRCFSASARSAAARSSTTYWRRNTVAGSNTQLTRSRKPAAVTTASNPTRTVTPRRICVVVSHSGIECHRPDFAPSSTPYCIVLSRSSVVAKRIVCVGRGLVSRQSPSESRRRTVGCCEKEEPMGRIVVTEFVSLDGVMEDPGGSESFRHGGWSFEIARGDEGDKFMLDETFASDALLLGRITYESFAGAWPSRDGEFADKFNTMPKYVVSSTLDNPEWNNTTVLKGDAAEEAAKLKEELHGVIQVPGSLRLVGALLESDLVDQLNLMVF